MGNECVFAELGIAEDRHRQEHDEVWRSELAKAYNDKAEKIVGQRLLHEIVGDPARRYPPVKQLHDIFEAHEVWHSESYWLQRSASGEDQLKALLDRVERRVLKNWRNSSCPRIGTGSGRGSWRLGSKFPCTVPARAGDIRRINLRIENLILLIYDNPELAMRFWDIILNAMLALARVLDEQASYTLEAAPHGFSFADDNCCLFSPKLYEFFGYPILKAVFARYSPNPKDSRY